MEEYIVKIQTKDTALAFFKLLRDLQMARDCYDDPESFNAVTKVFQAAAGHDMVINEPFGTV